MEFGLVFNILHSFYATLFFLYVAWYSLRYQYNREVTLMETFNISSGDQERIRTFGKTTLCIQGATVLFKVVFNVHLNLR